MNEDTAGGKKKHQTNKQGDMLLQKASMIITQTTTSSQHWPLSLQGSLESLTCTAKIWSSCSRWIMQILKVVIKNFSVSAILCCVSIAWAQSIEKNIHCEKQIKRAHWRCGISFTTGLFSRHAVIQNTVCLLYQIGASEPVAGWSFHRKQTRRQGNVRKGPC